MTEAHTDTDHAATDETDPDATNTDVGTFPALGTAVDQLLDTMRTERADGPSPMIRSSTWSSMAG